MGVRRAQYTIQVPLSARERAALPDGFFTGSQFLADLTNSERQILADFHSRSTEFEEKNHPATLDPGSNIQRRGFLRKEAGNLAQLQWTCECKCNVVGEQTATPVTTISSVEQYP
jgi:hypothetical protein